MRLTRDLNLGAVTDDTYARTVVFLPTMRRRPRDTKAPFKVAVPAYLLNNNGNNDRNGDAKLGNKK